MQSELRPANLEKNVDCVQVQVLSLLQLDVKKFYICFSIWISLRSVRGGGLGVKSTVCYQGAQFFRSNLSQSLFFQFI